MPQPNLATFGAPTQELVFKVIQPKNVYTPLYTATFVNGKAKLVWNSNFASEKNSLYAKAQRFVDSEVLRRCDPYIPFLTGTLIRSGILGTKIGSGLVQWIAPYAHYQYIGKVITNDPFAEVAGTKIVTNKPLQYHGGGKRGARWFERMKEVSGKSIINGAKKIIAGGE